MVSVCMASYNGANYIHAQLSSILGQIGLNDEVIISDDGSGDDTLAIIESFDDNRIRIVNGPCKKSPIHNFENALRYASGQFIFLSDQDDVWDAGKVTTCLNLLKQYDLVISDATIIDDVGGTVMLSFFESINSAKGVWKNIIKNTYIGACMCFRASALGYILPFPKYIPMHDSWIGLSCEINGSVYFLNEKLVFYRRHTTNTTTAPFEASRYGIFSKVKFRLQMIYMVLVSLKRKIFHH